MKTIGLIGGMSWESSSDYYRIINSVVKEKLGGLHSAKCILYSVDFYEVEQCQIKGDWQKSAEILANAAKSLEAAGADFVLICTNTMHKVAPYVQEHINIPLLHIATLTADELVKSGIKKVGLLGTKFTMEQDFYVNILKDKGLNVIIPNDDDRATINKVIFKELCLGLVSSESKSTFLNIISKLVENGAEAIILGCTEIGMMIGQKDANIPIFDTTKIHAEKAAILSIEG